jgi:hypothetical protein
VTVTDRAPGRIIIGLHRVPMHERHDGNRSVGSIGVNDDDALVMRR